MNLIDLAKDSDYNSETLQKLLSYLPDKESDFDYFGPSDTDPSHVSKIFI